MRRVFSCVFVFLFLFCMTVSVFAVDANDQQPSSYATFLLRPNGMFNTSFNFYAAGNPSLNNSSLGFSSVPGNSSSYDMSPSGTFNGFNISGLGGASSNFHIDYTLSKSVPVSGFSTLINRAEVSGYPSIKSVNASSTFTSIDFSTLPDLQVPPGGTVSFLFTLYPVGLSFLGDSGYSSMIPATDPSLSFVDSTSTVNGPALYTPSDGFEATSPADYNYYQVTTAQGVSTRGFSVFGDFLNGSSSSKSFLVRWYSPKATSLNYNDYWDCDVPASRVNFPSDVPDVITGVRMHFGVSYSMLVLDSSGQQVGGNSPGSGGGSGGGSGADYTQQLLEIAESLSGSNTLLQQHLPEIVALLNRIDVTTGDIDSNVKLIKSLLDGAVLHLENMAGTLTNIRTDTAAIHSLLSSYLHYLEDISSSVSSIETELKSFHSDFLSFVNSKGNPDSVFSPEQQEVLGSVGSSVDELDKVEDEYFGNFSTSFDGLGFSDFSFSSGLNNGLAFVGSSLNHFIESNAVVKSVLIFPIFLGFIKAFLNIPRFAKNIGSGNSKEDSDS